MTHPLAFEVDDLDQMIMRFKEKGVLITDGPTVTSSGSRLCFIEAPDKYEVELIERPPEGRTERRHDAHPD